jgi:uncharacterized repeat protein (TIGR04138 family)
MQRHPHAAVVGFDARFSLDAYTFVIESLQYTKSRVEPSSSTPHVTGQQLSLGLASLALARYGPLARAVLETWGIRGTKDIGDIVYHMIASGELEKTEEDSQSDFDEVFDWDEMLYNGYVFESREEDD